MYTGPIATHDAIATETGDFVEERDKAGLLAVDMEIAANFTVARQRGLETGAICAVSNSRIANPSQSDVPMSDQLHHDPEVADEALERAILVGLEAAVSL